MEGVRVAEDGGSADGIVPFAEGRLELSVGCRDKQCGLSWRTMGC